MDMDSFATRILEGRQLESKLNQQVSDLLARWATKIKLTGSRESSRATYFERIQQVKAVFDVDTLKGLFVPYESCFEKNPELSTLLKEKGNTLYKSKNVDGALRAYSLAAAFAPTNSSKDKKKKIPDELLLAYTNRSAVLLQKGKFEEALKDVQRALQILSGADYKAIPSLKEKLLERKQKCETGCKRGKADDEEKHKEILDNQFFRIENPAENIPNAGSFVQLKYSPERGRHLVVTKETIAGSVLLVDQPFVSVLDNVLRWEVGHCHNCSRQMLNGIPCKDCTFGLFCSDECRETASGHQGMHRLEHKYLSILHHLDSSHGDIQCLRIFAKVAQKDISELSKYLKSNTQNENGHFLGCDNNGIYKTNHYRPIFHLISHPPSTGSITEAKDESVDNALKAVLLKDILKTYSNYFGKKPSKEFEDLVASAILKHLESIKFNAISQSKLVSSDGGKKKAAIAYASAVFPLLSLCNHSCDPNCAPVRQVTHLKTSLVALKHLKEGEELFITYKPLYTLMKTSERQKFLAERYKFICDCLACEQNWGPDKLLQQGNWAGGQQGAMLILQPSSCEKCDESTGDNTENGNKKKKQCHDCALRDLERAKEIGEVEKTLFDCHDILMEKNDEKPDFEGMQKCLKRLPEVVDYFGKEGFLSYFPLYNVALDLYKRALVQSVAKL